MLKLQDFRSKSKGLPDLLPYAALIAPGVVLNKDGSFLAAFESQGRDTFSSTPDELAYVSAQFNNAVKLLGTGWMLHVDAIRSAKRAYPAPELAHFPDSVTRRMDDERRKFFGSDVCYATTTRIALTYKPNYTAAKLAGSLQRRARGLEKHLEFFQNAMAELEDALSAVLRLTRLTEYEIETEGGAFRQSDLLSAIQECVSGTLHPMRTPSVPMYLDRLLGGEDLIGGLIPRLGQRHIMVLSIDGLPQESWPAMLSGLDSLRFEYRFSSRFICLDQYDAVKEIGDYVKGWNQQIFGFLDQYFGRANPRANRDAYNMREDAEEAKSEVQGGIAGAGYLTSCIVLMDDDVGKLQDNARELRRAVQTLGFGCRIEDINALDAWLGSLPGVGYANVRRPLVNTLNLADLLPLSSVWTGSPSAPCPFYPVGSRPLMVVTRDGATPVWLNFHVSDVGHTLVFGPTGAGKSTFLAEAAAQFLAYKDATIFAFDKGMSLFPLCAGAGGDHYAIGDSSRLSFAPLQDIDQGAAEMAFAEEWIVSLLRLQGMTALPGHVNDVHAGMSLLREQPRHMRSLTNLWHLLPNMEIKEALKHYTRQGAAGRLLDADTDTLGMSRFMVFEMEEIMNQGDKNLIPVLTYLFHRIQGALRGQPAMILLDEAWVMLGHPVFRGKIREWLKVLRKSNCIVVLATQSLSDAKNSGILDVLTESCPTKVYLANHAAHQDDQAAIYRDMALNSRQLDIIARMQPKREYYLVQPHGCCKFQLNLSPLELAYVGASDKDSIARIQELMALHPHGWQQIWEAERA